jgi:hypothetical protein
MRGDKIMQEEIDNRNETIKWLIELDWYVNTFTPTSFLYHYTSLDALKSILESKKLRFTDIRFQSDKKEISYIIKLFNEAGDEIKKDNPEKVAFINIIKSYVKKRLIFKETYFSSNKDALKNINLRFFIFCSTKDEDSSKMWNGFTGNFSDKGCNFDLIPCFGENIENEKDYFEENEFRNHINCYFGYVCYDYSKQKNEIMGLVNKMYEKCKNLDLLKDKEVIYHIKSALKKVITLWIIFFKEAAYCCENEVRFTLSIPEDYLNDENFPYEYNKNIKCKKRPHILVPFSCSNIKRIRLSSKVDFQIENSKLENMLKKYNLEKIEIHRSEIKIGIKY